MLALRPGAEAAAIGKQRGASRQHGLQPGAPRQPALHAARSPQ